MTWLEIVLLALWLVLNTTLGGLVVLAHHSWDEQHSPWIYLALVPPIVSCYVLVIAGATVADWSFDWAKSLCRRCLPERS